MSDTTTSLAGLADSAFFMPTAEATPEQVLEMMDRMDAVMAHAKEIKDNLNAAVIEWIKANGDLVSGTKRWYVGVKKQTKCRDQKALVEAVLNATGGDVDKFCEMLGANAFKPGACRQLLTADEFASLFRIDEGDELRDGAAPKLQMIDSAFMPSKKSDHLPDVDRGEIEEARTPKRAKPGVFHLQGDAE